MVEGLPRKIKLAFLLQALVGSLVVCVGVLVVGYFIGQHTLESRMQSEVRAYWTGQDTDPAYPLPHTSTMRGYFVPARAGEASPKASPALAVGAAPPTAVAALPLGFHRTREGVAIVDRRAQGTLYVTFRAGYVDQAIMNVALVSVLMSVLTIWLLSWRTYRTSKRLVVPVTWLANVVRQWDPRNPDVKAITPARLPPDAGTEVRRLARALVGLADRVGNFVQREREFTRNASHELRTPLTVIRVAMDMMLAQADVTPRTQKSLLRVQRAGRDMEAVIDAFLLLAREADLASQSVDFQVRDVVEAELANVRSQLLGKSVEIAVVDEGAPRLHAPPNVLAVMLGNLLGNAARFTEQGRIHVLMAPDRVEVRDTGIGMAPEVLVKVFDPFYRADFSREDGKGMGLSIVRRLAERVGWSVSLSSEPGVGTLATIHFVR